MKITVLLVQIKTSADQLNDDVDAIGGHISRPEYEDGDFFRRVTQRHGDNRSEKGTFKSRVNGAPAVSSL